MSKLFEDLKKWGKQIFEDTVNNPTLEPFEDGLDADIYLEVKQIIEENSTEGKVDLVDGEVFVRVGTNYITPDSFFRGYIDKDVIIIIQPVEDE